MSTRPIFAGEPRPIYDPPVGPSVWHCHPDRVVCPVGHPLLFHKSGFVSHARVDGHVWHGCQRCDPTTFFFGVVRGAGPDPIVTFYRIDKRLFDFWQNEGRELELTGGTLEQLYLVGHNPHFQPARRASLAHQQLLGELRRLGYFTLIRLTP